MTDTRKSAKQVDARRRARERAAEFRARQDKLEQLAVDYFVASDSIEAIQEVTQRQIEALRHKEQQQTAAARDRADAVIQQMLDLGINRSEVAERLGIPTRDVKKTPKTSSSGAVTNAGTFQSDTQDEGSSAA